MSLWNQCLPDSFSQLCTFLVKVHIIWTWWVVKLILPQLVPGCGEIHQITMVILCGSMLTALTLRSRFRQTYLNVLMLTCAQPCISNLSMQISLTQLLSSWIRWSASEWLILIALHLFEWGPYSLNSMNHRPYSSNSMNHQINPYHNLYGAVMRFIKRQWNYLVASNSGEADLRMEE